MYILFFRWHDQDKNSWSKYQIKVNEKSYKNILIYYIGLEIKLNLDSDLPLKMLKLYNMVIAVRSVFHEGNKYRIFFRRMFVLIVNVTVF